MRDKTIAKITLRELKKFAEHHDYDWDTEVIPRLDQVIESVELNMDKRATCTLALGTVIGTPRKRREDIEKYG